MTPGCPQVILSYDDLSVESFVEMIDEDNSEKKSQGESSGKIGVIGKAEDITECINAEDTSKAEGTNKAEGTSSVEETSKAEESIYAGDISKAEDTSKAEDVAWCYPSGGTSSHSARRAPSHHSVFDAPT